LDREVNTYDQLFEILKQSVSAGIDIVQLRDKRGTAKDILAFSRKAVSFLKRRIPYIINDRIDLAIAVSADGVHLGQEDIPVEIARTMMGSKAIIGTSCQTLEHAKKAQKIGVDYIGLGSVFRTLTKPDRLPMKLKMLANVNKSISTPVFPIGGIDLKNVTKLSELGITRVAVCRSICHSQSIKSDIKTFKTLLE